MSWEAEREAFHARLKEARDRRYRELRASEPDLFRQCVQGAEGLVLNRHRALAALSESARSELASAIEQLCVDLVSAALAEARRRRIR